MMIEYRDTGKYWQEAADFILPAYTCDCFEIEFINDSVKWFIENWILGRNIEEIKNFVAESVFHNCDKWEPTYTQQDGVVRIDGKVLVPHKLLSCGMIFYYKVDDAN